MSTATLKRRCEARSSRSIFEPLEDRRLFASVYWTGGGGSSDWFNRFNWMGNTVPGTNDDVTINGNVTVQISSANAAVKTLQLGSGGTTQLTVRNAKRLQCSSYANVQPGGVLQVSDGGEVAGGLTNATGATILLRDGKVSGGVINYGIIESDYRSGGTSLGDIITGSVTNYSSGTIKVVGNAAFGHNFVVPTITNQGGLIEMSGAVPDGQRLAIGMPLDVNGYGSATINNQFGTISVQAGGQRWLYGSLQLSAGTLNVLGPLGITQQSSTASLMTTSNVNITSKLTLDATVFNVFTGSQALSGAGSLEATNGSTLNLNSGMWPDIATVKVSDSTINGNPNSSSPFTIPLMHVLNIDGTATFGRPVTNYGTVNLGTGEHESNTLSIVDFNPSFSNNGGLVVRANSTGTMDCYFSNVNPGILSIDGTLQFNTTTNNNWGKININDHGILRTPEAGFTNPMPGIIRLAPLGTIDATNTTVQNYSRIEGWGRIVGNVINNGILAPGGVYDPMFPDPNTIGTLTIDGNCTFGTTVGVLNAELKGTTAGTQYDQLVVTGTATLGSGLFLSRPSGFVPVSGNTFDVLTAGTRIGTFATVGGTELPNGQILGVTYLPTAARVGVVGNAVVPKLRVADTIVNEPTSGITTATFTVSLDQAANLPVTVLYATADGTAAAPGDYLGTGGTLTFAPGETSHTVSVTINSDTIVESTEQFVLNLSSPSNATIADGQGVCTIYDSSHPALIASLLVSPMSEGHTGSHFAQFTLSLSQQPTVPITFNYATADGTATVGDNDYTPVSGSIRFLPGGDSAATILVPVNGDTTSEIDETFVMNISSPNAVVLLQDHATETIVNDDPNYNTGGYTGSYFPIGTASFPFNSIPTGAPLDLQGHTFNFFGNAFPMLFPNLCGTITFDGPMTDPNNTDLSQETRPMIAAMWSDWVIGSNPTPLRAAIVPGSELPLGSNRTHDYLLIRWAAVKHPTGTQTVTFTTALELDTDDSPGEILVWYNSSPLNPTTSATLGVTNGQDARLLIAFNQSNPPVLQPGIALRMGQLLPAPAQPSAPDLIPADDTGISNTDNLTNRLRPSFAGTAQPGTYVRILADGLDVAEGTAASDGTYLVTCFKDMEPGHHTLRALADGGIDGMSIASAGLDMTVDVTAPTADVIDVTPDPRSTPVDAITIVFSEPVYDVDRSDLVLSRNGGPNLLTGAQTLTQLNDHTWVLGGLTSLTGATGNYVLTVRHNNIFDLAGNALAADASDAWSVAGRPFAQVIPRFGLGDQGPTRPSVFSTSLLIDSILGTSDPAD